MSMRKIQRILQFGQMTGDFSLHIVQSESDAWTDEIQGLAVIPVKPNDNINKLIHENQDLIQSNQGIAFTGLRQDKCEDSGMIQSLILNYNCLAGCIYLMTKKPKDFSDVFGAMNFARDEMKKTNRPIFLSMSKGMIPTFHKNAPDSATYAASCTIKI